MTQIAADEVVVTGRFCPYRQPFLSDLVCSVVGGFFWEDEI
jgi:hypothetical protein